MALDEGAEQPRREAHPGGADREPQPPGLQGAHARERGVQAVERTKDLLAAPLQPAAGVGQIKALADLLEQRNAYRLRELSKLH